MKQVKYIPVERIIENVRREVEFTDNINFADILEWVYYAMELIGAQQVYVQKTTDGNEDLGHPTPVLIENGRGELPIDLHQIIQVRDYNTGRVLRATIDSYLISKNNISFGVHDSRTLHVSNTTENTLLDVNSQYGRLYNSEINSGYVGELTYSVNNSYIFTSFDSGYIEISYMAFPTDNRGFPLIPEDAKYIKAVESYIIERVARRLWLQDRMSTDKYKVLEQEWLWYVGSAKGSMNTLSLDQMESLKNQLTRLIPRSNLHDSGFKTFGNKENITFGRKYKEKFLESFHYPEKEVILEPEPTLPNVYKWINRVCIQVLTIEIYAKWITRVCVQEDEKEIFAKWSSRVCIQELDLTSTLKALWINKICVQEDYNGSSEITTFYVYSCPIRSYFILSSPNKIYVFWFTDNFVDAPDPGIEDAVLVEVDHSETLSTLVVNIKTAVEALPDFATAVIGSLDSTGNPFYPIVITNKDESPGLTKPGNGNTNWQQEPNVVPGVSYILPSLPAEALWLNKVCVQEQNLLTTMIAKWINRICVQADDNGISNAFWSNKVCIQENVVTLSGKWTNRICVQEE
jgi:hypothetical protein